MPAEQHQRPAAAAAAAAGLQASGAPSTSSDRAETVGLLVEGEPRDPDDARPTAKRVQTPREAFANVLSSWVSKKFMSGCAILFPMVVTVYITWWFLTFFDNFFSPIYQALFGFHVFGLGFMTSMMFIFFTGVFVSSWIGGLLLSLGEWTIRKVPVVKHLYSASKQIGAAVNPGDEQAKAFKECVVIKHPRHGEYAFAFITGETTLQLLQGDLQLVSVYVPTNHVYVGDVFLIQECDIVRTNLSVREGLECVVSVGMAIPSTLIQTH